MDEARVKMSGGSEYYEAKLNQLAPKLEAHKAAEIERKRDFARKVAEDAARRSSNRRGQSTGWSTSNVPSGKAQPRSLPTGQHYA
jgi:hypothetical protein